MTNDQQTCARKICARNEDSFLLKYEWFASNVCSCLNSWKEMRLVSKRMHKIANSSVQKLSFNTKDISAEILRKILCETSALKELRIQKSNTIDDEIVADIFRLSTSLRFLDISYCQNVTQIVIEKMPSYIKLHVNGCPKLCSPNTLMEPWAVIELQILAIKNCKSRHDLIHFTKFLHPECCGNNAPVMIPGFEYLWNCQSYKISVLAARSHLCTGTVELKMNETIWASDPIKFMWQCEKPRDGQHTNCWLTRHFALIEHMRVSIDPNDAPHEAMAGWCCCGELSLVRPH
mmetsp:Transcript_8623/g.11380  ORF Transcript_8623/g.11380 Transcript_8623/m.11380 type:complete len:290 (+) Transcript_8623:192-1061(+)